MFYFPSCINSNLNTEEKCDHLLFFLTLFWEKFRSIMGFYYKRSYIDIHYVVDVPTT